MKAVIAAGEMRVEISESSDESASGYVISGTISPMMQKAIEQSARLADATYDSPACGSRLGWVASAVAQELGGSFVIEDEPPEEPGVVY